MTQERNNTYAFVIEDPSKPKRQQLNFHLDQFKEYKESTHIQSSTMDQSLASHHPHNPQHHSLHHVDHNPPPPRPTLPSLKDILSPIPQQQQPPLHQHQHQQHQQHQQRILQQPPPYLHHNNILPQHKSDSLRPHLPPLQPPIESPHNPNNFNYSRNERIDSHLPTISQHSHQPHTSPPHSLHQQHPLMPPSSDVSSYYPPHSSYNTNNQYSINHKINQIPPHPQHQITSQGAQHSHYQQPPPQLPIHQQQRTPPHQVQTLPQQMQPSQRISSHHQPSTRHHSHNPPSHSLQMSHHLSAQHQPQHQIQQLPQQQVPQAYHPPPPPSHHHSHMYNNDIALERSQHDLQSSATSAAPPRVPYSHPYYSQSYSNNNSVPQIMASAPSHVTTSNVEYRDSTPSGPLLNSEQHYHQQQSHVQQYSQHSQHSQHLQYQAPQQQQQMYVPYQQHHQPQQQQQQQHQQHQQQQQPQVPHLQVTPQSIHRPLTPPQLNLPPQQHSQQVQNQYLPENRETSPSYLVPPPHHHSGNSGSNSSVSTRSSSPAPSTPIAPTNHPFSPNNNLVNNPVNNNIVDKPSTDSSVKKRGRSKHRHIAPAGPVPNQPAVPVSQSIPSNASNESLVFVQYSNSSTNHNAAPIKAPQASRSRKNSITGGSAPSTSKRGRKAKDSKAIEDNVNISSIPFTDNNEKNFVQNRKRDHSWLLSPENQNKKKSKKSEEVHVIQDDDVVMDDNTHDEKEEESKINNMDIDADAKLLLSLGGNNYDDTVNNVNGVNRNVENNEKPIVEDIKIKEEYIKTVIPVVEPVIEPVVNNIEIKSEKFDSIDELDQSVTTKVKEMSLSPTRKEEDKSFSYIQEKKMAPRSPKPPKKPNDIVKSEVPEKNVLGINKVPNKKEQTKMTVPAENDSDSDLAMDDGSEDEADKNKQSEQGWNSSDMETEEEVEEEIEISGTGTSSIVKEDENKRNINFPSSTLTSNNINNQNNQKSNGNFKDIKVTTGTNSSNKKLSRPTSPISSCFTTTNNGTLSRKASTSSSISRKGSTSSNGSNKEKDNIIYGSPTETSITSPITSTLSSPLAKTMAADAGNSTTASINGNSSNTKPQRPCPPRRRSTMRDDEKLELNAIEWEKNIEIPHNIWEETLRVFEIVKHSKEMKNRQPHRKRNHILASILFILCRQNGLPRTFVEICNAASIRKQEIGTYYRLMLKVFESNGLSAGSNGTVDSAEYLKRWCQNLKLPPHILSAAIHVYRQASELNITTGKCPVSVGAASIWLSINSWNDIRLSNYSHTHPDDAELIKVEHKDVAQAAGVVNATLVGCFKNLLKYKDKLLPEGFLKEARDRSPHSKPNSTSNGNNNNSESDTYGQMSSLDNVKYYGSPTTENFDNGKQTGETTSIESRVEPTSKPLKSETVIKSPTKLQVKTERSETNNQSLKASTKEVEMPTKTDSSIKKEVKNEKTSTMSRSPPRMTKPAPEIEPGQEDADDELEEGELREDDEEMMMD